MKNSYSTPQNPREQEIIDEADYYTAYVSQGRMKPLVVECNTLEEVVSAAKTLANETKRIAIIYAVRKSDNAQAYMVSVKPETIPTTWIVVPAETVKVGNEVLTLDNTWATVEAVAIKGERLELQVRGPGSLLATFRFVRGEQVAIRSTS